MTVDRDAYTDLALELAATPNALGLDEKTRWSLAAALHDTGNDMAAWRARTNNDVPAHIDGEYTVHDVEAFPAINPWWPALLLYGIPLAVIALIALAVINR